MSGFVLGTILCGAMFGVVYLITQQIYKRERDNQTKTAH